MDDHRKWVKSSYSSGHGGACVEVAFSGDAAHVRDTKNRDGGTLAFNRAEWDAFIAGAADGEFAWPAA